MHKAWKILECNPTEIGFLLFDCGDQQKKMLAANNIKPLKDKTDRSLKTKAGVI